MGTGVDDLVEAARAWPARRAGLLEPVPEASTHALFGGTLDGHAVIVKRFDDTARGEHEREWDTLVDVQGLDLAPEPVHRSFVGGAPVVVMRRLAGASRRLAELDDAQLSCWAAVNLRLRAVRPTTVRPVTGHPAAVIERTQAGLDRLAGEPAPTGADRARAVTVARERLPQLVADLASVPAGDEVFCHGDPSGANFLWTVDAAGVWSVRMVDFEDAGMHDPAFELAEAIEHVANRGLEGPTVDHMVARLGLEHRRPAVDAARRLQACFWLVLVERWVRSGRAPRQVTPEEQAARVLDLLG